MIKHANATEIHFSALQQGRHIIIKIEDNGYFHQNNNDRGEGIKNMVWRAEQLGTSIDVAKTSSQGCCITLSIPFSIFKQQENGI